MLRKLRTEKRNITYHVNRFKREQLFTENLIMLTAISTLVEDTQNISSKVLSTQSAADTVQDLAMRWNIPFCHQIQRCGYPKTPEHKLVRYILTKSPPFCYKWVFTYSVGI